MAQVCCVSCVSRVLADSLPLQLAIAFRVILTRSVRRSLRCPFYTISHALERVILPVVPSAQVADSIKYLILILIPHLLPCLQGLSLLEIDGPVFSPTCDVMCSAQFSSCMHCYLSSKVSVETGGIS